MSLPGRPTEHHEHPEHHEESEWPSMLIGWIFIVAVLFGIVFMILHAKPEKKWVCDTAGRTPSLTQFGSCHKE